MAKELPATLEERIQAFYCQIMRVAGINKFEVVGNIGEWDPDTEGRRALFILDSFSAHITVTNLQLGN